MSVEFYPQDSQLWNQRTWLQIANANFSILRDLLCLESPLGDNTGEITADDLLLKIARARLVLQQQRKEWERAEEPSPEQQEGRLIILSTCGLSQDDLAHYLHELHKLALFAKEEGTGVKWS